MSILKILRVIGVFFIAGSLMGLYSLINESDPDCYYTTEVFLQARLCGAAYVSDPELPRITIVIICLAILIFGYILIKLYSKSIQRNDSLDNNEI